VPLTASSVVVVSALQRDGGGVPVPRKAGCVKSSWPRNGRSEGERMTSQGRSEVSMPRVSVVIPALNEARNLPHVFELLPADIYEVIVVDGNSTDDTVAVARRLRSDVRIVEQNRRGKGNALACGFAAATGDVIATVDADGSADPGEIPRFVEALINGADFAKGTRFASGGGSRDITRFRRLGNKVLVGLVNVVYRRKYTDLCYGFNMFWRDQVPVLGLDATSPADADGDRQPWGDGFEVETLIHLRATKAGLAITEVPSFEHSRIHGASNLRAVNDGLRVLRTILREAVYSRRHSQVARAAWFGDGHELGEWPMEGETALGSGLPSAETI